MTSNLTVVIVHRDATERASLRAAFEALPGVQIAGERNDLRSGFALAHQTHPAILVIDLAQPMDDALSAAAQFKMENPECAIFVSTDSMDSEVLLRALRAGAQEVLRRPLDRGALREAVERVSRSLAKKSGSGAVRGIITVFGNKGGSGVTTLATNIAISLRTITRREIALVDLDVQSGDAAFLLGLSPTRSLSDVMSAARLDSASVQSALIKHESGLYVLSQPEQLDRVDGLTGHQVGAVLDILSGMFDFVVVDAPHLFNDLALEIFDHSSTIVLVCEPNIPSVRAARRSLEIFHRLNFLVTPDRVRLVVNRLAESSAIGRDQIEETLGVPVFASIINDYASVSMAINVGKPLCGGHDDSRAGRDILALSRKLLPAEFAADETAVAVPAKRPLGLRLFGKG